MVKAINRVTARLEQAGSLPASVPVAGEVTLSVLARCEPATDLEGIEALILRGEEVMAQGAFGPYADGANAVELTLRAPREIGEHALTVRLPEVAGDGLTLAAAEMPVTLNTRPHATSLAVWGIEGAIEAGRRFPVTVGAKCSDGCSMAGREIEVRDHAQRRIAGGRIGETPWTGTLYHCVLELTAPEVPGSYRWSARAADRDLALPHRVGEHAFSFAAIPPPEHRLTVEVVEDATAAPVAGASIRIGPYRGTTDAEGRATIAVVGADYTVAIWKPGYHLASQRLTVDGDARVRLEATPNPDEDPQEIWI